MQGFTVWMKVSKVSAWKLNDSNIPEENNKTMAISLCLVSRSHRRNISGIINTTTCLTVGHDK